MAVGKGGGANGDLDERSGDDVLGAVGGGENETRRDYGCAADANVADEDRGAEANVGEEEGA